MFEFASRVYDVLAADAALTAKLSTVPTTNRPAIYVNHLSHFAKVTYPAVSLLWRSGGADQAVQCAEAGVFDIDVWTEERASDAALAGGLSGAWALYRLIKPHLHRAHLSRHLADQAYQLTYCVELDATALDDFDDDHKLYHIHAPFRVQLMPKDAWLAYPT